MGRQAQAVLAAAIVAILAASTIATASESGPRQTLESGFRLDPWKREVVAGGPNWDDCWQLPDEPQFVIRIREWRLRPQLWHSWSTGWTPRCRS